MALWGNNDAVGSGGTVSLNYTTRVVTGTGTTFGQTGAAQEGDVIRFGARGGGGTYFGDAVIVSIAGTQSLTVDSTAGLTGGAISGAAFKVTQCPKSTVLNPHYSEANGDYDALAYGVSANVTGSYHLIMKVGLVLPLIWEQRVNSESRKKFLLQCLVLPLRRMDLLRQFNIQLMPDMT